MSHTVTVTARPSKQEKGSSFWSTSFMLMGSLESQGAHRFDVTGKTPQDVMIEAMRVLDGIELAEEFQGWSISVAKPAGRWPNGFKAAFERWSSTYRVRESV